MTDEPESVKEGLELLRGHFFAPDEGYDRADAFRENAIRLVVFDMHLAIEELLRSHVFDALQASSSQKAETVDYVKGLSSRQVLDLSAQLGVIDSPLYDRLRELNTLRNKAAHHWALEEPIKHRSGADTGTFGLVWKGARLTPDVVTGPFSELYGGIYTSLFESWVGTHGDERDGPV